MKKTFVLIVARLLSLQAQAASVQHSAQGSAHASAAAAHLLTGTAKGVVAVGSIPLQAVGELGKASGQAGEAAQDWAHTPAGGLPLSDEQPLLPPNQQLQR